MQMRTDTPTIMKAAIVQGADPVSFCGQGRRAQALGAIRQDCQNLPLQVKMSNPAVMPL